MRVVGLMKEGQEGGSEFEEEGRREGGREFWEEGGRFSGRCCRCTARAVLGLRGPKEPT